jgi:hypothetical protein
MKEDKPGTRRKYVPLKNVEELESFLTRNQDLLEKLDSIGVKLTSTGRIIVLPAAGCPFAASGKCHDIPPLKAGNPARLKNLIVKGES